MQYNLLTETPEGVANFYAVSEGVGHPNDIALSIIQLNFLGLLKGLFAKQNRTAITQTPFPNVIHIFFSVLIKTAWFTPEIKQETFNTLLFHAEILSNAELLQYINSLSTILSKEAFEEIIQIATDHKNDRSLACQKLHEFIDRHTMLHHETPKEEISDEDIPLSTLLKEYENLSTGDPGYPFINPELLSEFPSHTEKERGGEEDACLFRTSSFFCYSQDWVSEDENPPQDQAKSLSR